MSASSSFSPSSNGSNFRWTVTSKPTPLTKLNNRLDPHETSRINGKRNKLLHLHRCEEEFLDGTMWIIRSLYETFLINTDGLSPVDAIVHATDYQYTDALADPRYRPAVVIHCSEDTFSTPDLHLLKAERWGWLGCVFANSLCEGCVYRFDITDAKGSIRPVFQILRVEHRLLPGALNPSLGNPMSTLLCERHELAVRHRLTYFNNTFVESIVSEKEDTPLQIFKWSMELMRVNDTKLAPRPFPADILHLIVDYILSNDNDPDRIPPYDSESRKIELEAGDSDAEVQE